jgi:phosphoribosylglycinamide formyltransferase-1
MLRVAILISGRGSNMQSLIKACAEPGFPAQIVCVISNKADAGGLAFAQQAGIATHVISHKDFATRQAFEEKLDAVIEASGAQLVCLAGFMRILTSWFTERWRDRLVNIHPSLLPAFPGLHTHEKAIDYGAKLAGCTVHYVRAEMDHGPIIIQAAVPVEASDTPDTLAARVLTAEHQAYPTALRLIAEGRVNVFEERTFIADAQPSAPALFNPAPAK